MAFWVLARTVPYPTADSPARQYQFVATDLDRFEWVGLIDQARLFDRADAAKEARVEIFGVDCDHVEVRHSSQHPKADLLTYWRDDPWSETTRALMETLARGDSVATVEILQARAVAGVGLLDSQCVDLAKTMMLRVDDLADAGYVDAHRRARQGRFKAHLERIAAIGRGEICDDPALVATLREQLAELDREDEAWKARRENG